MPIGYRPSIDDKEHSTSRASWKHVRLRSDPELNSSIDVLVYTRCKAARRCHLMYMCAVCRRGNAARVRVGYSAAGAACARPPARPPARFWSWLDLAICTTRKMKVRARVGLGRPVLGPPAPRPLLSWSHSIAVLAMWVETGRQGKGGHGM